MKTINPPPVSTRPGSGLPNTPSRRGRTLLVAAVVVVLAFGLALWFAIGGTGSANHNATTASRPSTQARTTQLWASQVITAENLANCLKDGSITEVPAPSDIRKISFVHGGAQTVITADTNIAQAVSGDALIVSYFDKGHGYSVDAIMHLLSPDPYPGSQWASECT